MICELDELLQLCSILNIVLYKYTVQVLYWLRYLIFTILVYKIYLFFQDDNANREGFGAERYETLAFQREVALTYENLRKRCSRLRTCTF